MINPSSRNNMFKLLLLFIIAVCCGFCFEKTTPQETAISKKVMNSFSKYLYIDRAGNTVLDASMYRSARNFSEGMAVIESNEYFFGFIDKSGEIVINAQYQEAGDFSEGLAAVKSKGAWGFIDKAGRMVIKTEYELLCDFSEDVAVAKRGNYYFLIGKTGQEVHSFNKEEIQLNVYENTKFSSGLIEAFDPKSAKWGYIDKTGKFVIEPRFWGAAPFSDGLARVSITVNGDEKVGFIDTKGKFVIPPRFNTDGEFQRNSNNFSEGLASLTEGLDPSEIDEATFAFIDKTGEIILPTNFFHARSFQEGLAVVYDEEENKYGYIDKAGKLVIPLKFDSASDFSEGLAVVSIYN